MCAALEHPRPVCPALAAARVGSVSRKTKETSVEIKINLDGTGVADVASGIPFLDHMLDQIASHGLFDLTVKAQVRDLGEGDSC